MKEGVGGGRERGHANRTQTHAHTRTHTTEAHSRLTRARTLEKSSKTPGTGRLLYTTCITGSRALHAGSPCMAERERERTRARERERNSASERENAREMHILLFCLPGCPTLPTSLSPLYLLCSFRDTLRDILRISTPPLQSPHPIHTHRDSAQTQRGHTQTHLRIHHRGCSGPRSAHKELSRKRGLGRGRLWCLHHVT